MQQADKAREQIAELENLCIERGSKLEEREYHIAELQALIGDCRACFDIGQSGRAIAVRSSDLHDLLIGPRALLAMGVRYDLRRESLLTVLAEQESRFEESTRELQSEYAQLVSALRDSAVAAGVANIDYPTTHDNMLKLPDDMRAIIVHTQTVLVQLCAALAAARGHA